MAKSKIRILPGTGGEFQVGGKPWGEVRSSKGTTKPTKKQSSKIKDQRKKIGKSQQDTTEGFKRDYLKGKSSTKRNSK